MRGRRQILRRLGFQPSDRVLVVHDDDVGMCEATVTAHRDLVARHRITAASTMVPCGWFAAVARWCREHADAADMGVHLTLNSEWVDYRWAPVNALSVPSLVDDVGYFHRWPEHTWDRARPTEVHAELRAQLLRARAAGIEATHIDSHILALKHPVLVEIYLALSREFRVPSGITRGPDPEIERRNLPTAERDAYYRQVAMADEEGLIAFDAWVQLALDERPDERREGAKRLLDSLPEGLTVLICHPATDTPELRAIAPDWSARVADYELLRSDAWQDALHAGGVKTIGMRPIQEMLFGADRSAPRS